MKKFALLLITILALGLVAAQCGAQPTPQVVRETVVVEKPVEKVVKETVVVEVEKEVMVTPTAEPMDEISQLDPGGTEITFWHVSTKIHEEKLMELVDEFNATNPWGITVKPEYGGYYPDIRKKILAAIAAESPPDLAVSYQNMVAEYAEAGAVANLEPYLNSEKYGLASEAQRDYFEAFLNGDRYPAFENAMLSFPPNRSMEVMYYNKDMLQEIGFEGPPTTWDQFYQACKALKEQKDLSCYPISPSASTFAGWVWSRGGEILSEDGSEVAFQEQGIEALSFLETLVDEGLAYQIGERYGDQTDFANAQALFTFGSTAGLPYYAAAVEDEETGDPRFEWSIAPMPTGPARDEPVVDMYGPSITVFETAPERELASWLFLKWFTQPENTAEWAMATNYFPVRKTAASSKEMVEYFSENPLYAKAFSFLDYAKTEPSIAGWQAVRDALGNAIVAVITGEKTPEQAVNDAAAEAQEVISE